MISDYAQEDSPKTFIGREIQLSPKSDYSMIVSRLRLPSGKQGVIGLVGPKSMQYEKNLSLLEYISKILGSGLSIVVLVRFFN